MRGIPFTAPTLVLACAALFAPADAVAAESYANCTGFIDSVPATLTTQGNWCLRADLSSALASGAMITVATNNVVLDCNDFKLGGLAAGPGTAAVGILAVNRANLTVRNCNLRGFALGIQASGGDGGHLVERSRFDGNRLTAIFLHSPASMVRDNLVVDTGNTSLAAGTVVAINASSGTDIVDNAVYGVATIQAATDVIGIRTDNNGNGAVVGNRVRGLSPGTGGVAYGIWDQTASRTVLSRNTVVGDGLANSVGIRCTSAIAGAHANTVAGFDTGIQSCATNGNVINSN